MKGTEHFVSLYTNVDLTEECNVMINSEELIGTIEYLTLQTKCRIDQCRGVGTQNLRLRLLNF
jgi:hypothetical protein